MPLLAIETSTRQLGLAVVEGGQLLASYELLADYPHAVELPGATQRVLREAHTTLAQLTGIGVDLGPGSFTGLRIGLAFVKALAFQARTPVVGLLSLDVLAAGVPWTPKPVWVLLDAKQKNVYAAGYRLEGARPLRQGECLLGPVDDILRQVREPSVFLGDGAALYRDRILAHQPQAEFAPAEFWYPRAATLARLGIARLQAGERDDPRTLVPRYLYPMDCSVRGPNRPTAVLPPVPQAA